ncbi:MAG TPA: lysine--tRNA ligase, partial [Erysipelotrichaceae bacterium]|nr:lysine--tRNA ligase [Erysipelotrichaceae bacterium]
MERVLNDQEIVRREKAQELLEKGIDPFGSAFERTSNSKILHDTYDDKTKEELEEL